MLQKLITWPFWAKRLKSIKRVLLVILAMAIASITIILGQWQQQVKAQDITINNQNIQQNSWGNASFPVENFISYTSPFGYRNSPTGGGNTEFHRGLDLAAPQGSYIRNWWNGTVKKVSDDTACGTSIIMESGEWEHIYCHLKGHVETIDGEKYLADRDGGILIKQGQFIKSGMRMARVGMTGRTTGP
ncbi:MAG TPA: M23 family metallopeptidase, partial [Allocoleopsis sp.]